MNLRINNLFLFLWLNWLFDWFLFHFNFNGLFNLFLRFFLYKLFFGLLFRLLFFSWFFFLNINRLFLFFNGFLISRSFWLINYISRCSFFGFRFLVSNSDRFLLFLFDFR